MTTSTSAADRLRGSIGALALTLIVGSASADQLSVPQQFATIQAAVDAAQPGDEILVSPGTYDRVRVEGKAVSIRSTGGQQATIIDGDGSGPAVLMTATNDSNAASFNGFTVRGGISENGAGLYLVGPVTIEHTTVTGNQATNGGGAFIFGAPILRNVRFAQNAAANGGGVFIAQDARPVFEQCTFDSNDASIGGGAHLSPRGFSQTTAEFIDCVFSSNTAARGAGISAYDASFTMHAGEMFANMASSTGGAIDTDALSDVEIFGTTIRDNNAADGAAIYTAGGSIAVVTDATIHGNAALNGQAAMHAADGEIIFGDSRLYANAPQDTAGSATDVGGNIFSAPPCSDADMAEPYGLHSTNDIVTFINAFNNRMPEADVSPQNNVWDVNDVIHFVLTYINGCD